ncbi:hypothetical protein CLPU_13c00080 [Gottschalkia purinilytica]|uniref:Uncharacterized protein n=1 Tax=Gottschalkia purinilytica TaxID=1503 RepID=A0A0L0W893_GOTPU|nr:hypothetical protein [Gottschalkia purinilytica]KNF07666.1 hypothetical protein CLPU_13c00080 [Gottschalkia purinilytica]
MFAFGIILFLVGTLVTFMSDRLYRRGKITTVENLLKVKMVGLGVVLISIVFMTLGNKQ